MYINLQSYSNAPYFKNGSRMVDLSNIPRGIVLSAIVPSTHRQEIADSVGPEGTASSLDEIVQTDMVKEFVVHAVTYRGEGGTMERSIGYYTSNLANALQNYRFRVEMMQDAARIVAEK